MIILFGTRGVTLTKQSGTFQCPNCGPQAPYSQKNIRRFFTLFFVPVIPLNKVASYVECHRCKGQFDLSVLPWNPRSYNTRTESPAPTFTPNQAPNPTPPAIGMPPMLHGATISQQSNGLATASMILGILGLVTSFLLCPAFVLLPLSLIFGIIGLANAGKLRSGKAKALTGIICSVIGAIVVVLIFVNAKDRNANAPPPSAIEQAKSRVHAERKITGYGNTEQAKALAESVARQMQALHDATFYAKKGKKSADQYVVHCELREKTCAFLIFVPDYRKLEDDAKTHVAELAWTYAATVAGSDPTPRAKDRELCVALRDIVLFGTVMTGKVSDESPQETSSDESEMYRFFPTDETDAKEEVSPDKETSSPTTEP
jgi:hypothetical protein